MNKKGFIKTASVSTIAVATHDGDKFQKAAGYQDISSGYLDSIHNIDIAAALKIVAHEYEISPHPSDYIFEAIRGNTVNVPNENNDSFHKNELLRFDHRLGKQVYRTYELKPHHVQHRSEVPKNARGFIVDAHYNDSAPPLETCPNCNNKTAGREGRDESGIHCAKCGNVVKDEFVELLVAIDRTKDPTFAQGVLSGVLKHGSMGCSCLRTRCNICGNVAYTRSEFCSHIARSKGKEYDDSEPKFNPIAYIIKTPQGHTAGKPKKTARAYEWCEGVIFDEYSRVHDPADPKAEQYEILHLNAKVAELEQDSGLRHESEILTLQARVAELERKLSDKLNKTAQLAPPAPDLTPPPPPAAEGGGVTINIDTSGGKPAVDIQSGESLEEIPPPPGTPIEEMTPETEGLTPAGPGATLTPEAMGIVPEAAPKRGASINDKGLREILNSLGGPSMLRFATSYKHIKAEITGAGNIRVFDPEGTLFVVKPDQLDSNIKTAATSPEDLAKAVLIMVADHGIGGAIKRTNAIVGPRLAQVLEYAVDDIEDEERVKTDTVRDMQDSDTKEKRTEPEDSATAKGSDTDREEEYDTKDLGNNALSDRTVDVEDERHDREPGQKAWGDFNVLEMQDSDTRDKRDKKDLKDSPLEGIDLDHQEKAAEKKTADPKKCEKCKCDPCECKSAAKYEARRHAARLEALYKSRLDKRIAEIEKERQEFQDNLMGRVSRAMKLVARRQALNLEYSPIKMAMGLALCNRRALNEDEQYNPMDQRTAVQLIEAAFSEPLIDSTKPAWEAHIDGLIERTASVMKMNDEALMQVEADLHHVQATTIPFDEVEIPTRGDNELRQAAKRGNLQLSPRTIEDVPMVDRKRESIRKAVGTTKVAGLAGGK